MKFLELFRGGNKEKEALDDNPYLNARRTLNEANGALIQSRHMWQATALLALMLAIGAVGGIIHIGSQSKFVPYVIEVDKLGHTAAVRRADRAAAVDERVVHATLAAFVQNVRMVSFDRNVQNAVIWRVFALLQSGDAATNKITEFMKDPKTNPTQKAMEYSVGVEISSMLRQTDETWEVNWVEQVWNRQGMRMEQYHMRGLATIYFVPPTTTTTEEEIRRNPLGLYVKDFTWSRIVE